MSAALPTSLQANPLLSQWLAIHANGTVSVYSGKVELGQGIGTALAQIAAEELDVSMARIRMCPASTAAGPNEGVTSGSLSVQDSGSALRLVCAQARSIYLAKAVQRLGLRPDQLPDLVVDDGLMGLAGDAAHRTSYWALADAAWLACPADGKAVPKAVAQHRVVGQRIARLDLADKLSGQASFIHDLVLPGHPGGILHGRVLHPPAPGAQLIAVDLDRVRTLPGVVAVLRDGNFLGLLADDEALAVRALAKLASSAQWHESEPLPDEADLPTFLRAQPLHTQVVAQHGEVPISPLAGEPENQPQAPTSTPYSASYSRPFLAHAAIAPSCALALWQTSPSASTLQVWSHSQGIHNLRADLALMLALPPSAITVQHVPGSGCYGHNGADDAAADAALLARAVPGRPVRLVWSRASELGSAPFGPAMAVTLCAQVGADGLIAHWEHQVWSSGHSLRPGRSTSPVLLAGTLLAAPFERQVAGNVPLANGGGAERNAQPSYAFAQWRAISHRTLTMPLRTSALRSLGAHCNGFASESFMDELAAAQGADPLAFRLRHLPDERGRAVVQAAAQMADWAGWRERKNQPANLPPSADSDEAATGLGLAYARYKNTGAYCAVVAQIEAGHTLRVKQLWIAVDIGLVINPDGACNQIEGGAIQTVSWVPKEAVQFDRNRVRSTDWEAYPILRFSEVPAVQVQLMARPNDAPMGAGEATHGPVAAAIANAVADALGVRVRSLPLTVEAITQAALNDAN